MGNFRNYAERVHTHNMFFQILAETGLIGIGAFGFLLWNIIRFLIKAIKTCQGRDSYIVYGAMASLIFFFVHNILDFTLGHGIGIRVGIILAILDSVYLQGKAVKNLPS